jgi:TfuA protein
MNCDSLPVVFAGISLSRTKIRKVIAADVRDPVMQGDLDKLSDRRVVAIIDGELTPGSILPLDEVRRSLDRGMTIVGAASLGALRAYEMREEGMKGYGWVYEAYCANRISGTDEIAVAYQPYWNQPLTVPLVNVRFCLDRLVRQTKISVTEAANVMGALKAIEIEDRDWQNVLRRLVEMFGRTRVQAALASGGARGSDVKRLDAYRLIRNLRSYLMGN